MGGAPYDERNEKDYANITKRIEAGLEKIKTDETVPATGAELCKLAKCSRGTLRNREWPLERLKEIKKKRKEKKARKRNRITRDHLTAVEVHVEDKNKLKDQLKKSRTEAAVWFHKFQNMEAENKRLRRANNHLQSTKQHLQEQLDETQRELLKLKPATEGVQAESVVVPFPQPS
jgi:phosphatidate phosphatase PAH1